MTAKATIRLAIRRMGISLLILLVGWHASVAQQTETLQDPSNLTRNDSFALDYNESTLLFERGQYEDVNALLKKWENRKLDRDRKELMFKRLSSSYFEIDSIEKGEEYIEKVYKNYPYFTRPESDDPSDLFYQNLERFECRPVLAVSLKGGLNFPIFRVADYFTIIDASLLATSRPDSFVLKPSGHFSLGLDWNITKKFTLSGELYYMFENYERKIRANGSDNTDGFRNTRIDYSEAFGMLRFPVTIRYNFNPEGRFIPSAFVGAYVGFIVASTAEIKLETERLDGARESNLPAETFPNMVDLRNQLNYGVTAGAKVDYRLDYLSFFLEGRFSFDLTNFEDESKRYSDPKLNYEFYYVDNKSKLLIPELSIGIRYNVFHPVKKKIG